MMPSPPSCLLALASLALSAAVLTGADPAPAGAAPPGQLTFATYCAVCHGPEGAGLVGPNLTDNIFLHGGRREDILLVITKGVDGKGMPSWEAILSKEQISQVADFAFSLIGKNLPSPIANGHYTVTPFPKGSLVHPLLMRSFMPTEDLGDEVFPHYQRGLPANKYSPETGKDAKGVIKPEIGLPTTLSVNFGDQLSYCFDTTECRLLYCWSGGFMDMTRYWGPGAGGDRTGFNYVPVVMGTVGFLTKGKEPMSIPGVEPAAPAFRGYRKIQGVPQLRYSMGSAEVELRIVPGDVPGKALLHTTVSGAPQGVVYAFHADIAKQLSCDKGTRTGDTLTLSAAEAASFTLTIAPAAH
jgi:mono/diheme cytochrome c family protein